MTDHNAANEPNFLDDADPMATGPTSPADIASAARGCSVILLVLVGIVLLLCVAFAIHQLS